MQTIHYEELVVDGLSTWLVVIEGDEYWLPKSECDIFEDACYIDVPIWLCEKKGLPVE